MKPQNYLKFSVQGTGTPVLKYTIKDEKKLVFFVGLTDAKL